MFEQAIQNISENISVIFSGISGQHPIPISISQTTDPWQFAINTGVVLISGIGILAVPMFFGAGNPIKKAKSIKEFNRITGRPSIVIDHGKAGLFMPKMIDNKTVTDVIKAMNRLGGRDFNLVLNTGGGAVFSSQLLSDAMIKYPGKIHAYIPKYSMSGGSLLALSCSNIHMTEYSSLGMIDPQVGSMLSQGSAAGWKKVVDTKKDKANDNSILHNITGQQVTKSLKQNIYNVIKDKTTRATEVADFLTSGEHEHIYQIKRDKLIELGFNNIFNITPNENKLLCEMVD